MMDVMAAAIVVAAVAALGVFLLLIAVDIVLYFKLRTTIPQQLLADSDVACVGRRSPRRPEQPPCR